jgi:hypothetical protein
MFQEDPNYMVIRINKRNKKRILCYHQTKEYVNRYVHLMESINGEILEKNGNVRYRYYPVEEPANFNKVKKFIRVKGIKKLRKVS